MREVAPYRPYEKSFQGAWVPGLPHLLLEVPAYESLRQTVTDVGKSWYETGVRKLFFFSTQWRSVLGHSFLQGPDAHGEHVDENWYDFGPIPYDLRFDPMMVADCARAAQVRGFQAKTINYPGFPLDTGTLVAHALLTQGARQVEPGFDFLVGSVSCSIYADYLETYDLARSLAAVLRDQREPCAVVVVSQLSQRTLERDYGEIPEQIASPQDQLFNEACLQAIKQGNVDDLKVIVAEKGADACADMSLRGLAFLEGLGLWGADLFGNPLVGQLHAYGPVHGTGAAVIGFNATLPPPTLG